MLRSILSCSVQQGNGAFNNFKNLYGCAPFDTHTQSVRWCESAASLFAGTSCSAHLKRMSRDHSIL